MCPGRVDQLREDIVGGIGTHDQPRELPIDQEGCLEDQREIVPVDNRPVYTMAEGRVDEELDALVYQAKAGNELSGIRNEVRPTRKRQAVLLEPTLQSRRAREDPDAVALLESILRLLLNNLRLRL